MLIAKLWHFLVVLFRPRLWWFVAVLSAFAADEKVLEILEKTVDEKALEILDKTSAYYQGLEDFRAVYGVTIKYPEEDTVQCGKMEITARGQQYRLSYGKKKTITDRKTVDKKETITDGKTVWVYDEDLNEVTISEYAKTDSDLNFAELYNLYQQGYQSVYIGERIVHKTKNIIRDIVQLTPLDEGSSFKSITLEVDRATAQIHRWEVVQNEETRYICTVCRFSVNIPLSDDYFTFDMGAHPGVEVIDLRESEEEQCEKTADVDEG
ncbi:MAG: outer membrane lipoprotein carrier protein LolA [Candidatus Cardinium sp.]|uniref:LolA family protein n=1 Tax=Cardinium endosymbiont of Dermatophagoides farinae TaxID=2597823 RepID=UPI00164366ED|nr:outer membrane lipoprotein carrier protein LolA [Cardinium endosymbiont of Dermatophagoides farinae]UWW96661.1 MAG: outer membrane lipoprotein carrier protein LolA [Candidatus Cardinium sp.]